MVPLVLSRLPNFELTVRPEDADLRCCIGTRSRTAAKATFLTCMTMPKVWHMHI